MSSSWNEMDVYEKQCFTSRCRYQAAAAAKLDAPYKRKTTRWERGRRNRERAADTWRQLAALEEAEKQQQQGGHE